MSFRHLFDFGCSSIQRFGTVIIDLPELCAAQVLPALQVCSCLSQIAKHSVDLAEVVVEAEIFPRILHCLKDVDESAAKISIRLGRANSEPSDVSIGAFSRRDETTCPTR